MLEPIQLEPKRKYSWKTLLVLMAGIIPACYLAVPYIFTTQSISLDRAELPGLLLSILVNGALYSTLAAAGL